MTRRAKVRAATVAASEVALWWIAARLRGNEKPRTGRRPRLAEDVVIDFEAKSFCIDGEEFPWHIAPGPSAIYDVDGRWGTVTVAIQVNGTVEVKGGIHG